MIGFTVFVYFQVPETKGKTIEEIAGKFAPSGDKIEVRPNICGNVNPPFKFNNQIWNYFA